MWDDLERVADVLGAADRGRALKAELANRVTDIVGQAPKPASRPRLVCIEWTDPLMAAGNWVPELVSLAGAESPPGAEFGEVGQHSPWIEFDQLRAVDPDVIAVFPCGFDIPRIRQEMDPLIRQPGWDTLRAVEGGHVYLADGNQYFNRPGPRLVDSLEILVEMLHPEVSYGHRGVGWEPL